MNESAKIFSAVMTSPEAACKAAVVAYWRYCFYCARPAKHADHIIPLSLGGETNALNLIASCAHCNCKKGKKRLASKIERAARQSAFIAALIVDELAKGYLTFPKFFKSIRKINE